MRFCHIRLKAWLPACAVVILSFGDAEAMIEPVRIPAAATLEERPYSSVGYIRTAARGALGVASGSVVDEGVVLTAAHVVYDTAELRWVTNIRFAPRHHEVYDLGTFFGKSYYFNNFIVESAYADRAAADRDSGMDPGLSSFETFNLDVAVAWRRPFSSDQPMVPGGRFEVVGVDPERPEGWVREPFAKKVLGYPSADEAIPDTDQGYMHAVASDDHLFYWDGRSDDVSTHRDTGGGGFWNALYSTPDFRVYSGNSGGPVFVRDPDFGRWTNAAVVVGGSSATTLVRAIDELVWEMVEEGAALSGRQTVRRATNVRATADSAGDRVRVGWSDPSPDSAEVAVLRQAGLRWEEIARVVPDATEFVDTDVLPGGRYVYAVQPVSPSGNLAPRSDVAWVSTPGANATLGAAVSAPLLTWATDGEVAFVPYAGGARSGRVPSLGASLLSTTVTGPGELTFRWSVSSERNTNLPDRGTTVPGGSQKLYDTFYFFVDGDVRRWISGEVADETFSVTLPAGTHDLAWEYRKDPYADELEDAGFLHEVTWTETGDQRVYGAFDTGGGRMWAHWWGFFHDAGSGWVFHEELGWLYIVDGEDGFWCYSPREDMGWFHTAAGVFPGLFIPESGWAHYRRGSGRNGEGAEVFVFGAGRWGLLGAGL